MTETPDLSTLPARMRYAKTVVDEADARYGSSHPWIPWALLNYADKWEAEDNAAAEREQVAEQLATELYLAGGWPYIALSEAAHGTQSWCRDTARKLAERGWTRAVDK